MRESSIIVTGFFFLELRVEISQTSPRIHHAQTPVDSQVTRAVTLWGLHTKSSDLKWGFSGGKKKNKLWTFQIPNVFGSRLGLCWCHHVAAALGSQAGTGGAEQAQNPHGCWTLLKIFQTYPGHGEMGKFISCYCLNLFRSWSVAGEINWSCLQSSSCIYVWQIYVFTLIKTKGNQIRTKTCYYNQPSHCLFVNMPSCPRLKHFFLPRGRKSQTTEMWFWQLLFPFFSKSLKLLSQDLLYNFPGNYSEWQG